MPVDELKELPIYDMQSQFRKKSAKMVGKVVAEIFDDSTPPRLRFFGIVSGRCVGDISRTIFRTLKGSQRLDGVRRDKDARTK